MRLISVELRRYFSRWTIRFGWLAAFVFIAILGVGTYFSAAPPTDAEIAEAQVWFERDHADWEEHGDEWREDCLEEVERERQRLEEAGQDSEAADIDFGCDDMEPKLEHYLWSTTYQEDVKSSLYGGGAFIVLTLALGAGITFMASEFTTGTMSTWLTFEPRRQRVYASKLAAVGIASALLSLIAYGVLWLIFRVITAVYDLQPVEGEAYQLMADSSFGAVALRVTALTMAAGLIGVALASVIRHTAGAIIVVVGYVIIEQIAQGLYSPLAKYALSTHVQGVVLHGATYYVETCESVAGGMTCEYVDHTIAFSTCATVIGVLTLVIVLIGAWRFQRRDVN